MIHNAKCAARHITEWAIYDVWFANAVQAIKGGMWIPAAPQERAQEPGAESFNITKKGVAILSLEGPLMKAESKYGGTSTVTFRQQLRAAVANPSVKSIVMYIDSPGGTVAGTSDAAAEVARANKEKPVFAHIDDLGASAAYWIASQATGVYANDTALVGSIGTYSVVYDASKNAEMQGIEVHVISTGDYKGSGVMGAPVTEKHLEYAQARVDSLNQYFLAGVKTGRGMTAEAVRGVADGRVWIAKEAASLGLVDKVQSFDSTITLAARAGSKVNKNVGTMARAELAYITKE